MIKLASEISLTSMHNYISRILSKKQPHSVPELDGSLLQPDLNTSLLGFVKAHSDDTLNDQADRLAHLGNSSNKCINVNSHTLPCMRGPNRHNIPLNCNFKNSNFTEWNLKNASGFLSTIDQLKDCYPLIFSNSSKCFLCNAEDNFQLHLWTCLQTLSLLRLVLTKHKDILVSLLR
ncbi:hypothetical protein RCL_jg26507.t1 [Rhizophagus clarus]|uniref:Uncharacterized protein n=1 Tax=Rhizophagus clarus TaxID=94130 RepID=A0A8H3QSL9_9GLOM|nr:hypothetical protein RCL_jg26507.t1 [Rhizophagus clarus]